MYLSKLTLNPRHPQARLDAANCHELHRTLLSVFPQHSRNGNSGSGARSQFELLFRVEEDRRTGEPVIIAQSRTEPDWSRLPAGYLLLSAAGSNPACKPVEKQYAAIVDNQLLRFRLRANPTKRCGAQGVLPGHRLGLTGEADQLAWLERKAAGAGFRLMQVGTSAGMPGTLVPDVRSDPAARQLAWRRSPTGVRTRLVFGSVLFEGLLRVTDAALFRAAITGGIGSGKAYGFGLLSVAPV